MATTYVYCTTQVDAPVNLALTQLGPNHPGSLVSLSTSSVAATAKDTQIMSMFRMIDQGIYILDTSLTIAGTYIASLQIMLRGHSFGSMIWWRCRTGTADIGQWYTDPTGHSTTIAARGKNYTLTLTGLPRVGYNDLGLTLVG